MCFTYRLLVLTAVFLFSLALGDEIEKESPEAPVETVETPAVETTETPAVETPAEETKPVEKGNNIKFDADVSKMLSILIHSLYTNPEVFLRELISNSADALNKVKLISLTKEDQGTPSEVVTVNDQGEEPEMNIQITVYEEERMITIRDGGIGMTRDELKSNLGSLGSSGTQKFFEKIKDNQMNSNLIGQFGVGFYSVFLAAARVEVSSKHDDSEKQWIWESNGDQSFLLYEDPKGNTLGRGTEIKIFLKEEAEKYINAKKIKDIILKYSEFVPFPVFLKLVAPETSEQLREMEAEKKKPKEDPDEVKEAKQAGKNRIDTSALGDDVELHYGGRPPTDADEVDIGNYKNEEADKIKVIKPTPDDITKKRIALGYEHVNHIKPIWTRPPHTIKETEYHNFFFGIAQGKIKGAYGGTSVAAEDKPLHYSHFRAEGGEVDFTSILYIPTATPRDFFSDKEAENLMRLYVRRVFITDEISQLLPKYLSFIIGMVDSDDLPLHVSREQLQEGRLLKGIKKRLTKKALAMLAEIVDRDNELLEEANENERRIEEAAKNDDLTEDKEDPVKAKEERKKELKKKLRYPIVWKEYGRAIKMGYIDDGINRGKIAKLMRFRTNHFEKKLNSLDDYCERADAEGSKNKKYIYFYTAESIKRIKQSPMIQDANAKGVEVLFMNDPIDEYMIQHLTDYGGRRFINLGKEGVKTEDMDTTRYRVLMEKKKKKYQILTDWLSRVFGPKASNIFMTSRKTSEAFVVSTDRYTASPWMLKQMQNQAHSSKRKIPDFKVIVEYNPSHPLVYELYTRVKAMQEKQGNNGNDLMAEDLAHSLYDVALVQSGFEVLQAKEFSERMGRLLRASVDISTEAPLRDEESENAELAKGIDDEVAEEEEKEKEGKIDDLDESNTEEDDSDEIAKEL